MSTNYSIGNKENSKISDETYHPGDWKIFSQDRENIKISIPLFLTAVEDIIESVVFEGILEIFPFMEIKNTFDSGNVYRLIFEPISGKTNPEFLYGCIVSKIYHIDYMSLHIENYISSIKLSLYINLRSREGTQVSFNITSKWIDSSYLEWHFPQRVWAEKFCNLVRLFNEIPKYQDVSFYLDKNPLVSPENKEMLEESINYSVGNLEIKKSEYESGDFLRLKPGLVVSDSYFNDIYKDVKENYIPQIEDIFQYIDHIEPDMMIGNKVKQIRFECLDKKDAPKFHFRNKECYLEKIYILLERKEVFRFKVIVILKEVSRKGEEFKFDYFYNGYKLVYGYFWGSDSGENPFRYGFKEDFICEDLARLFELFVFNDYLPLTPDYFKSQEKEENIDESVNYSVRNMKKASGYSSGDFLNMNKVITFSNELLEEIYEDLMDNYVPEILDIFPYLEFEEETGFFKDVDCLKIINLENPDKDNSPVFRLDGRDCVIEKIKITVNREPYRFVLSVFIIEKNSLNNFVYYYGWDGNKCYVDYSKSSVMHRKFEDDFICEALAALCNLFIFHDYLPTSPDDFKNIDSLKKTNESVDYSVSGYLGKERYEHMGDFGNRMDMKPVSKEYFDDFVSDIKDNYIPEIQAIFPELDSFEVKKHSDSYYDTYYEFVLENKTKEFPFLYKEVDTQIHVVNIKCCFALKDDGIGTIDWKCSLGLLSDREYRPNFHMVHMLMEYDSYAKKVTFFENIYEIEDSFENREIARRLVEFFHLWPFEELKRYKEDDFLDTTIMAIKGKLDESSVNYSVSTLPGTTEYTEPLSFINFLNVRLPDGYVEKFLREDVLVNVTEVIQNIWPELDIVEIHRDRPDLLSCVWKPETPLYVSDFLYENKKKRKYRSQLYIDSILLYLNNEFVNFSCGITINFAVQQGKRLCYTPSIEPFKMLPDNSKVYTYQNQIYRDKPVKFQDKCFSFAESVKHRIYNYKFCEQLYELQKHFDNGKIEIYPPEYYHCTEKIEESVDYSVSNIPVVSEYTQPYQFLQFYDGKKIDDKTFEDVREDIITNVIPDILEIFPDFEVIEQPHRKNEFTYYIEAPEYSQDYSCHVYDGFSMKPYYKLKVDRISIEKIHNGKDNLFNLNVWFQYKLIAQDGGYVIRQILLFGIANSESDQIFFSSYKPEFEKYSCCCFCSPLEHCINDMNLCRKIYELQKLFDNGMIEIYPPKYYFNDREAFESVDYSMSDLKQKFNEYKYPGTYMHLAGHDVAEGTVDSIKEDVLDNLVPNILDIFPGFETKMLIDRPDQFCVSIKDPNFEFLYGYDVEINGRRYLMNIDEFQIESYLFNNRVMFSVIMTIQRLKGNKIEGENIEIFRYETDEFSFNWEETKKLYGTGLFKLEHSIPDKDICSRIYRLSKLFDNGKVPIFPKSFYLIKGEDADNQDDSFDVVDESIDYSVNNKNMKLSLDSVYSPLAFKYYIGKNISSELFDMIGDDLEDNVIPALENIFSGFKFIIDPDTVHTKEKRYTLIDPYYLGESDKPLYATNYKNEEEEVYLKQISLVEYITEYGSLSDILFFDVYITFAYKKKGIDKLFNLFFNFSKLKNYDNCKIFKQSFSNIDICNMIAETMIFFGFLGLKPHKAKYFYMPKPRKKIGESVDYSVNDLKSGDILDNPLSFYRFSDKVIDDNTFEKIKDDIKDNVIPGLEDILAGFDYIEEKQNDYHFKYILIDPYVLKESDEPLYRSDCQYSGGDLFKLFLKSITIGIWIDNNNKFRFSVKLSISYDLHGNIYKFRDLSLWHPACTPGELYPSELRRTFQNMEICNMLEEIENYFSFLGYPVQPAKYFYQKPRKKKVKESVEYSVGNIETSEMTNEPFFFKDLVHKKIDSEMMMKIKELVKEEIVPELEAIFDGFVYEELKFKDRGFRIVLRNPYFDNSDNGYYLYRSESVEPNGTVIEYSIKEVGGVFFLKDDTRTFEMNIFINFVYTEIDKEFSKMAKQVFYKENIRSLVLYDSLNTLSNNISSFKEMFKSIKICHMIEDTEEVFSFLNFKAEPAEYFYQRSSLPESVDYSVSSNNINLGKIFDTPLFFKYLQNRRDITPEVFEKAVYDIKENIVPDLEDIYPGFILEEPQNSRFYKCELIDPYYLQLSDTPIFRSETKSMTDDKIESVLKSVSIVCQTRSGFFEYSIQMIFESFCEGERITENYFTIYDSMHNSSSIFAYQNYFENMEICKKIEETEKLFSFLDFKQEPAEYFHMKKSLPESVEYSVNNSGNVDITTEPFFFKNLIHKKINKEIFEKIKDSIREDIVPELEPLFDGLVYKEEKGPRFFDISFSIPEGSENSIDMLYKSESEEPDGKVVQYYLSYFYLTIFIESTTGKFGLKFGMSFNYFENKVRARHLLIYNSEDNKNNMSAFKEIFRNKQLCQLIEDVESVFSFLDFKSEPAEYFYQKNSLPESVDYSVNNLNLGKIYDSPLFFRYLQNIEISDDMLEKVKDDVRENIIPELEEIYPGFVYEDKSDFKRFILSVVDPYFLQKSDTPTYQTEIKWASKTKMKLILHSVSITCENLDKFRYVIKIIFECFWGGHRVGQKHIEIFNSNNNSNNIKEYEHTFKDMEICEKIEETETLFSYLDFEFEPAEFFFLND